MTETHCMGLGGNCQQCGLPMPTSDESPRECPALVDGLAKQTVLDRYPRLKREFPELVERYCGGGRHGGDPE